MLIQKFKLQIKQKSKLYKIAKGFKNQTEIKFKLFLEKLSELWHFWDACSTRRSFRFCKNEPLQTFQRETTNKTRCHYLQNKNLETKQTLQQDEINISLSRQNRLHFSVIFYANRQFDVRPSFPSTNFVNC